MKRRSQNFAKRFVNRVALAIGIAVALLGGCTTGSHYESYSASDPNWSGAFPDEGADLRETIAGIHAPRSNDNRVNRTMLDIFRLDVEPWEKISANRIKNGTYRPVGGATYGVVLYQTCKSRRSQRGYYSGEKLSWYLLPGNRLKAYRHYEFLEMCSMDPTLVPARGKLVPVERRFTKYVEENYPTGIVHINELYEAGFAYLDAGRIDDARAMLELAEKSIDASADRGVRHDSPVNVTRFDPDQAAALRRGVEKAMATTQDATSESPAPRSLMEVGARKLQKGNLPEAEDLVERAVEVMESDPEEWGPEMEQPLRTLAQIRAWKGDLDSAIPLMERSLAIHERVRGKVNLDYASGLAVLAGMHLMNDDLASAELAIDEAVEISERFSGRTDARRGVVWVERGYVSLHAGDPAAALESFQLAIGQLKRRSGAYATALGLALVGEAAANIALGNFDAAARSLAVTNEQLERALGAGNPAMNFPLELQALAAQLQGQQEEAIRLRRRSNELVHRYLTMIRMSGYEEEWRRAAARLEEQLSITATLAFDARTAPGYEMLLDTLLQRKGRALETVRTNYEQMRRQVDPRDRHVLDELAEVHARLARLVLQGPDSADRSTFQIETRRLAERAAELEDEMSRRSAAYRARAAGVDSEQLRQRLPEDAALVEFTAYRRFDPEGRFDPELEEVALMKRFGSTRYAACVLRPGAATHCIDVGESAPVDASIRELRDALADPRRTDTRQLGRALDERLMQPVRAHLGDAELLLLSPDGALNLVPFAALVDEHGRYLIERFTISYLTTGRDLLRSSERAGVTSAPLILADPAFDLAGAAGGTAKRRSLVPGHHFAPLPDTAAEGRAVKQLLADATLLMGSQASKHAIQSSEAPGVLHIATHAFWLGGEEEAAPPPPGMRIRSWAIPAPGIPVANPLLRSGLALAGANDGGESGLLTALEVSTLDLDGTGLVVLSACDTGLGELHSGEGIYGLRRALVLAGAITQVTSLWKVADRGTRHFMQSYYARLVEGAGRAEALRSVQLELLESPEWRHPFFWAAFTTAGGWGPLSGQVHAGEAPRPESSSGSVAPGKPLS